MFRFIWDLKKRWKIQRLAKERNYVKDKHEQIKLVTLGTVSFVTLSSFSITISTEFSMASFWKQQTHKIKQSIIISQNAHTRKNMCNCKYWYKQGHNQTNNGTNEVRTWFLSISTINERASSLIEKSESSNTSSTAVKIWLKYCNYTMKPSLHQEDKSKYIVQFCLT